MCATVTNNTAVLMNTSLRMGIPHKLCVHVMYECACDVCVMYECACDVRVMYECVCVMYECVCDV